MNGADAKQTQSFKKAVKSMENDFIPKDIREVEIDTNLTSDERKAQFLQQTGSSTEFKVGDVNVKCTYGSMDIDKMLSDLIGG